MRRAFAAWQCTECLVDGPALIGEPRLILSGGGLLAAASAIVEFQQQQLAEQNASFRPGRGRQVVLNAWRLTGSPSLLEAVTDLIESLGRGRRQRTGVGNGCAVHNSPVDRTTIRQESYFLRVVVPFVERSYPVRRETASRLLVGFSKSGWGAFSLLLRHPDVVGKAAAWDAPLAMSQPNRYGMEEIFATQKNFERYRITSLLKERATELQSGKRLIHLGYGNFRDQHLAVESLLEELHISHAFRDGPQRPHAWDSGWLPEAVQLLTE